jgi:hypothetical protein
MGNMAWKIIRTEEAYQAALSRLEEIFDCNYCLLKLEGLKVNDYFPFILF